LTYQKKTDANAGGTSVACTMLYHYVQMQTDTYSLAELFKSSLLLTPCMENCAHLQHETGRQPSGSTCNVQRHLNRQVRQLFTCVLGEQP